ncbi:MAG: hypothetical protein KKH34_09065 [Candidatus Omnitrophica bacterium]|nr:hypothetical protein [Candidatus Omnitrophota bacterium]
MRYLFSPQLVNPRVINASLANPVFFLLLLSSCILLIATIALRISGFSRMWEKRCAVSLLFSGAALAVWLAYFVNPRLSVYHWILIVWISMSGVFLFIKLFMFVEEKILLKKSQSWRCPRCKEINTNVFVQCRKCNASRKN